MTYLTSVFSVYTKLETLSPLSFVLSWYEQKAVCILLTLLHLGIKNIRLGPSLPAFLSPNILNFLVENYGIAPVTTPEEDIKTLMNHSK
jgi:hydroxylamine reductase